MSVVNWQYKTYDGVEVPIYMTKRVRVEFVSNGGLITMRRELEIDGAIFCVHWYRGELFWCAVYFDENNSGNTATITCTDVYTDTPDQYGDKWWDDRPQTFMNVMTYNTTLYYPSTATRPYFYFGTTKYCHNSGSGSLLSALLQNDIFGIRRSSYINYYGEPEVPPYYISDYQVSPLGNWSCGDTTRIVSYGLFGDGEHVDPDSRNPEDEEDEEMIGAGVKSGLFSVYIPTDFNMDRFTQWLWGGFDITQLKKLFNEPMESIISLHALYMDIPSQGTSTIHLGNLDSEVGCPFTTDTIKTISCGSVSINETFENVLDYDPYTKIEIYLPYIGFRPLKASEVMGGSVSVSYKVDIVTGACVALVSIHKNDNTIVAYSYSGNCAISLPVTGANYRDLVRNITSTALSVGSAFLTGGATAPLALGAVGNLALGSQVHVERSGSITANSGMLGDPIPYIIITKPVPAQPTNFEQYYGYPASQLTLLSACSGYTRVKDCHLSLEATEKEKEEIENILKTGVII